MKAKKLSYVNAGGTIGLRQVEHVLFKLDPGEGGIKIAGNRIWENEFDTDLACININYVGYQGGTTKYRRFGVYDGKNNLITMTDPNYVGIYTELSVETNNPLSYAAHFFNDGDNENRYGIGIQCGKDVLTAGITNYPIRFRDGNGDLAFSVAYNDTVIDFVGPHSDIRLKENIKDYAINGLDIIDQMQYRSFNWKKDPDKREAHGWVADEVEKFFPEMVFVDPETGYKMISQGRLIPVMMAGIKELNIEVQGLNERIETLEQEKKKHSKRNN